VADGLEQGVIAIMLMTASFAVSRVSDALRPQRQIIGGQHLDLGAEVAQMDRKNLRVADTVNIPAPLTLTDHRAGLPGKTIQGAALGSGELAGGQFGLAIQLEQSRAQGAIHDQAATGSMICQLN